MYDNINVVLLQALNPLYAIPIIAVIVCAILVYAFGFKSPVQPPSFEGIEEEKKHIKKRRGKDNQKVKVPQNGKLSSALTKGPIKKKDTTEKDASVDKPVTTEKTPVLEKKASKKLRQQNGKKSAQEGKKENASHSEANDDGWVQLVSKKGRKNRKKDDMAVAENQPTAAKSVKILETNKSDDSSPVEESPKKSAEPIDVDTDPKQVEIKHVEEDAKKELDVVTENDKTEDVVVEVSKPVIKKPEKEVLKGNAKKDSKRPEENNKSKKKKKKNADPILVETDSKKEISDSLPVQVISEIAPTQDNSTTNIVITAECPQVVTAKVDVDQVPEIKPSNVAFDELAGLYPDVKEQKRKKKVRREH